MKVLAILTSKAFYGKERANIEVYQLLRKWGHDVHVIVSNECPQRMTDAMEELTLHPIVCPDRHNKRFNLLRYAFRYVTSSFAVYRLIRSLKADFIFMNYELDFYNLYPSLRLTSPKIIYRVGDAPAWPGLKFKKYNRYVWDDIVNKRVLCVVSNAIYIQKALKGVGRNNTNDVIIYNYPPSRKKTVSVEKSKYIKNKAKVTFGFIGQISLQKGVDLLIENAVKLVKEFDVRFYIAGNIYYEKEFGERLKSFIPKESTDKIVLLGEIDDLDSFYGNIDVLVTPSIKQEPMANVISEAKMHHIPNLIFPSGGMPEIVRHKVDGYICRSQTKEALMEGLLYYLENPDIIGQQGEKSFDSIHEMELDRKHFEMKWKSVIDKMK